MIQDRAKKRPKRVITVDGIRYSLDSGDTVNSAKRLASAPRSRMLPKRTSTKTKAVRVAEKPLPKAVSITAHHQAVMHPDPKLAAAQALHPHNVSHPALPLQQRSTDFGRKRMSAWRDVIIPSVTDGRDSISVWASLGIVLLSPLSWLAIFIPAAFIFITRLQDRPVDELYRMVTNWLLNTTSTQAAIYIGLVAAAAGAIWIVRHLCLMVAYALASRTIDNRPVSARTVWWQAAGKLWRLVWVALFETLIFTTVSLLIVSALRASLQARTVLATQWGLLFNITILFAIVFVVAISIYRPLSRVMLALTNRPAGMIVSRCFGLLVRNWLPALGLGLVWLLVAGLTAVLVSAMSWATLAYGLLQITTLLGRLLLLAVAGLIIMLLLMIFTIWSVDFWPRSYRWLALRAFPGHVSRFMAGAQSTKSKPTIVRQAIGLVIIYLLIIVSLSVSLGLLVGPRYRNFMNDLPPTLNSGRL